MKRILAILLLIPLLTIMVSAAGKDEILKEQTGKSGAAGLFEKVPETAKSALDGLKVRKPDAASLSNFTPSGMIKIIGQKIKETAKAPVRALVTVLGIILLCALLGTMKNAFSEKTLESVFHLVCALCVVGVVIVPITKCVSACADVIKQASVFMLAFLPVYAGLLTVSGHPASAVVYHSLLLFSSQAISEVAATTFVPMIDIYLVFCVIGSISSGINLSAVAGFVRKAVEFCLGLCITIFIGILTIQGLISQAEDTVAVKTAKFVVSGAVPIIGNTISDAMNTVVGCANILKTTTGAFAIVVMIVAFLPPIIECAIWILTVDLSLAVAEVLGVGGISGLLKGVKEVLRLLAALLIVSALAMVISITVTLLIGLGN